MTIAIFIGSLLAAMALAVATIAQSTLTSLQNGGGSLASAFKDTESCQSLGS